MVQRVGEELLVYDLARHRAHCLGPVAAAVWRSCDGVRTLDQIAARAAGELGTPVDAAAVRLGLARLRRARLVEGAAPPPAGGQTRRAWLRTAALAGLSVVSITAPLAAQAVSCIPDGQCANLPNTQCSGRPCCSDPVNLTCARPGGGPNCTCR